MAATMSGAQVSALAYALPPLQPRGLGKVVEVTAILLGIFTTIIVALRVYVRAGFSGAAGRVWGIDDYLVILAYVCMQASYV